LSVDAFQVMSRLVGDLGVAVSPVGVDGGIRSPVAVGLAEGLVDGLADGLGDVDGDGDGDGLVVGAGVTRPVIVQDSTHWSAVVPGTTEQFWADGAVAMTARTGAGAATAAPIPPASRHATPTAMCVANCFARCM
jgi:hypothetical protein